jgi:hypothetical protein
MRYHDGQAIHVGDVVKIDLWHEGTVVGCIEDGIYLQPHSKEQWTHLENGVLIDSSHCGLKHYADEAALASDSVALLKRSA